MTRTTVIGAAAVAAVAMLTCGCSSNRDAAPAKSTTTTVELTTTTVPVSTSTTVDPVSAAVLAAYRAHWDDFIAVAETFPVKPLDPRLAQHATGKQLTSEQQFLTQLSVQGHYAKGGIESHPVVTAINSTTATVNDCGFDHSVEMDGRSNTAVGTPDVGHTQSRSTLALINGNWFVSDSTILKSGGKEDACTPVP
jgi:hypothetical protein